MRSYRLISTLILTLAVILLPYWIYLPLLFVAVAILPMFWEGILLGFLIDALYSQGISVPIGSPVALSILAALVILLPLRARLRTYV
ncbi:MAG: hypothetical protein HYT69_00880 [Candidatus Zambryskibacteria bacterium]|nr:hypothetical protein [Candidatus Zambryskibacteria bacterium]